MKADRISTTEIFLKWQNKFISHVAKEKTGMKNASFQRIANVMKETNRIGKSGWKKM